MAGTKFDGNGTTISFGVGGSSAAVLKGVNTITFGGIMVEAIDDTSLDNAAVMTAIPAKLSSASDITANVDASQLNLVPAKGTNCKCTITLPGGYGSYVAWGFVSQIGDITVNNGENPTADVTFKVSNLNASGTETAPVLTIGGSSSSSSSAGA